MTRKRLVLHPSRADTNHDNKNVRHDMRLLRRLGIVLATFSALSSILVGSLQQTTTTTIPESEQFILPLNDGDSSVIMSGSDFRSLIYYNLSCPYEWSKYSCIHQDQTEKAEASRELLVSNRQLFIDTFLRPTNYYSYTPPPNSRLLITGDSLMRQVFVGAACLLSSFANGTIQRVQVDWHPSWPCRHTIRCVAGGRHSGFSLGSILFANGAEIHFLPHGGALPNRQENKMYERMEDQVRRGERLSFTRQASALPTRLGEDLTERDIVVANVGIHYGMQTSTNKVKRLEYIARKLHELDRNASTPERPRIWYITTPTQHFDSPDGRFPPNGTDRSRRKMACVDTTILDNPRATVERSILKSSPAVRVIDYYDDSDLGSLHVGLGDCSHYCMPGAPDVVALRLLRAWRSQGVE